MKRTKFPRARRITPGGVYPLILAVRAFRSFAGLGLCSLLLILGDGCGRSPQPTETSPPRRPLPECNSISTWNGHDAAVSFTTDDGEITNRLWADVCEGRRVGFTMFVVPAWLGRPGHLSVEHLRNLYGRGFEIGAHGLSHVSLITADDATLDRELVLGRDLLRHLLNDDDRVARVLAYPYQHHDERVMNATARYYMAARDGGLSPQNLPHFSRGVATWDSVSVFEVPMQVTIASLVENNTLTEEDTRARVQRYLPGWKARHQWSVLMAHTSADCDPQHLDWILDELQRDGGVWIASFGEVAEYYLTAVACPQDLADPAAPDSSNPR